MRWLKACDLAYFQFLGNFSKRRRDRKQREDAVDS